MKAIIVLLLICGVLATETELCRTTNHGFNQDLPSQFETQVNRLRSQVAMGSQKNHKGEIQPGANMNELIWWGPHAQRAQICAQKCPSSEAFCGHATHTEFGVLQYRKPVVSISQAPNIQQMLTWWMQEESKAAQLLVGRAQQFGCGRAIDQESMFEYVVCVFDKQHNKSVNPYVYGKAGTTCAEKSVGYAGLCATSFSMAQSKTLVAEHHTLKGHTKHNKHKSHNKHNAHKLSGHKHHNHIQLHAENWGKANEGGFVEANQWFKAHPENIE